MNNMIAVQEPRLADQHLMKPYLDYLDELNMEIVRLAAEEQWYPLMDRMDERAQVMQQVSLLATDADMGLMMTLTHSVAESDRAMNTIMSLALAAAHKQNAA